MIKINEFLYYRKIEKLDLVNRVNWINDPEINKTLTFSTPVSLAATEKWFETTLFDNSKLNLSFFVKKNDDFIPLGFAGFIGIDSYNQRAELFITIGNSDYHGKGFGVQIVKFLISFGFIKLNLSKIYLTTLKHNFKAKKLYEKCGFKIDGELRDHFYHHGEFVDCYHMSILRKEIL